MIYFDNAATTKMNEAVIDKMMPYFSMYYGNPSSQHQYGFKASRAVENSRETIAQLLGVKPEEIYFTAGGTESDNMILRGLDYHKSNIVTSDIEHHAIINTAKDLMAQGVEVRFCKANTNGLIDIADLSQKIDCSTRLVSVMYANNETGVIQPIQDISAIAHANNAFFHTDAVQVIGHKDIDTNNIDMLSASAHKFGGPKGIGFAYIKEGIDVKPFITGGAQERNYRAGTLNVPAIVGMAEALKLSYNKLTDNQRIANLRDRFESAIISNVHDTKINGCGERLAGITNISFLGLDNALIVQSLDMAGLMCSAGPACSSGIREPSHVLKAMGINDKDNLSSVRFSIGTDNTAEEIDKAIQIVIDVISRLRK